MGDAFPELVKQQQLIENVIKEEELSFLRTLEQGLVMLENIVTESKDKEVSGVKAFELYDTFGFPIDLTALILKEKGFSLNIAEFEAELKKQKERSRAATQVTSGDWEEITEVEENAFVGYDQLETQVKIAKYRKVETKKQGTLYQIVLTKTPFYPEGGGQVGDKGYLKAGDEKISIIDTKKESNQIIHFAKKLPQDISAEFTAVVDASARAKTAANHTATHLLHQALRQILGTHVEQKGSMVQPNYMRFDFSHFSKPSSEEIEQVEEFVNDRIKESLELEEQRNIAHQEALDQGAIALFGEKYGDSVRAIRFGKSMELCGGTHVKNTADIWYFKITGESAVASGIRRIEAITGDAVKGYFTKQTELLEEVQGLLKNAKDPVKAISGLQDENAELKKQVETLLKDKAKNLKSEIKNEIQEINGIQFLAKEVDLDAGGIKDLAFQLGGEIDNLFLLFGTEQKGKALLSCYISKDLVGAKDLNAGTIVRELGKYIQGGGGGQPFFATAGGKNPAGISEALAEAKKYIE